MMFRRILLTLVLSAVSSTAFADTSGSGTPEEQAACRPDVRKFCAKTPPADTDTNTYYLTCLETHRDQLSIKCLNVLMDHGR
jgi:hypothetical protein